MVPEGFLTRRRPDAFGDQVLSVEAFAAAPNAGCCIEGHLFLDSLVRSALFRFTGGNDHPLVILEVYFFEFPDLALASAVAGLILEKQNMVFRGCGARASIVVPIHVLVVDRQHWHSGCFGVWR